MNRSVAPTLLAALWIAALPSCSSNTTATTGSDVGASSGTGGGAGGSAASAGGSAAGGGGASSSVASSGTSSSSGSGGGAPGRCAEVSGSDFGDCAAPLGWAFDGKECKSFDGCSCAPDCDKFFPDPVACATSCAALGFCDEAAMKALYLAEDPFVPGNHCDGVYVCTPADVHGYLEVMFPDIVCEFMCSTGDSCAAHYNGTVTADEWEKLCAVSLLPKIDEITCVVYGP